MGEGIVTDAKVKQFVARLSFDDIQWGFCSEGSYQALLRPCLHVCALTHCSRRDSATQFHSLYTTDNWRRTYNDILIPLVNGLATTNVLPPPIRAWVVRLQIERREAGQRSISARRDGCKIFGE